MVRNIALITGVTGQDGSYLADLLLSKGYEVHGVVRRSSSFNTRRLEHLYHDRHAGGRPLTLHYGDVADGNCLARIIREVRPTEIYNLAAQSHVRVSFDQPTYTADVTALGTLRLLEALRDVQDACGDTIRFYQASSSEMYGKVVEIPQKETTPFHPRSPYGVAKTYAHWITVNYRESYGLHASCGILFNHESPLRPERFVTQKIVAGACRVAAGEQDVLSLGDLSVRRDWGWAPEYVVAMHRMLQLDTLEDFVIATGQTTSLEDFVREVFASLGLDWRKHVVRDPALTRPSEILSGQADTSHATAELGWTARSHMKDVARMMVEARLAAQAPAIRRAA